MQNHIAKSQEQALALFIAKKAEIDAMLTRLGVASTSTITPSKRSTR